ncbi:MAG: MASE1 domain-containing protein, partial [Vicinamibacterales bacterium]
MFSRAGYAVWRVSSSSSRTSAIRAWSASNSRTRTVLMNVVIAVIYWGLAELVLLPATEAGRITALWPPAGLAVALVFLGGRSLIPGVVLGAFAVVAPRVPLPFAILIALATALEPLIDVRILRALKFDHRLERIRDPLVLALVAGPAGALVTAAVAVTLTAMAGQLPDSQLLYGFGLWWLRNWLGVVLTASLIFTWVNARPIVWTWPRIVEGVGLFLAMFAGAQLIFGLWGFFARRDVPIAFVFFPLVGWAGLRFGPRGAATVVALIAAFALGIAGLAVGPFATFPIQFIQFLLFVFLMMGWLSGHLLAAMMAERDDALAKRLALEEQLRHSQKMEAVGRLAGGIAHDFNNLLTAIIGYTELVLISLDAKHDARSDAEEIARLSMRAADLTRQ